MAKKSFKNRSDVIRTIASDAEINNQDKETFGRLERERERERERRTEREKEKERGEEREKNGKRDTNTYSKKWGDKERERKNR